MAFAIMRDVNFNQVQPLSVRLGLHAPALIALFRSVGGFEFGQVVC